MDRSLSKSRHRAHGGIRPVAKLLHPPGHIPRAETLTQIAFRQRVNDTTVGISRFCRKAVVAVDLNQQVQRLQQQRRVLRAPCHGNGQLRIEDRFLRAP